MASATLKIRALDIARDGFPLELTEDSGTVTQGLLPRQALASGHWIVELDPKAKPGANDIARTVADTDPTQRLGGEWPAIGNALYEFLFPVGPMRERWPTLEANDTAIHLDIESEILARVPWELARSAAPVRRLATNHRLSRIARAGASRSTCSEWPFRILLVIGCTPEEAEELRVAEEQSQIERMFLPLGRSVDVQVLPNPSRDELMAVADEWHPHVLHFAGHTDFEPGTDTIGLSMTRAAADQSWIWSSDNIQADLPEWKWTPRFVFLNACRTGAEAAGSWSMQRGFMSAGVRAVLSMQADVRGDLAGLFACELYGQLARGETVQDATRAARVKVLNKIGDKQLDWTLPSLVASEPALKLFSPLPELLEQEFRDCAEFNQARFYANCRPARRLFTNWIKPARPPEDGDSLPNMLLLLGEYSTGKSHLLKWSMESWAMSGARVRYISLHSGVSKDFLAILAQIRDGDADGQPGSKYLHEGLPPAAFRRFNWELGELLETGRVGVWDEAAHAHEDIKPPSRDKRFIANSEKRPEPQVCRGFLEALNAVAVERPLILVFDQLGGPDRERLVDPQAFMQLMDYLFRPIAENRSSRVKLAFSVTPDERGDYGFGRIQQSLYRLYEHKHDQTDDELVDLADEMFRHLDSQFVTDVAKALFSRPPDTRSKGLARLESVLVAMGYVRRALIQQVERMR